MSILKKIQKLPEKKRKIILWIIVVVIGVGMLIWLIGGFGERLKVLQTEELKKELRLPELKQKLDIPEFKIPEFEISALLSPEMLEKKDELLKAVEILRKAEPKIEEVGPEITKQEFKKIIKEVYPEITTEELNKIIKLIKEIEEKQKLYNQQKKY